MEDLLRILRVSLLLQNPLFWFICCTILSIYYVWSRRKLYVLSWHIPGPLALPFIGNIYTLMECGVNDIFTHLSLYMSIYRSPCRMFRLWAGPELYVLVADAGVALQMSRTAKKASLYQSFGGDYMNDGLIMDTDVDHWKRTRKVCQPTFGMESLKTYIPIFHRESLDSAQDFEEFAISGKSCMPFKFTGKYSYYTSMRVVFDYSRKDDAECENLHERMDELLQNFQRKIFMPLFRNNFIYWLVGLRQKEKLNMIKLFSFIQKVIDECKLKVQNEADDSSGNSLLSRMITNRLSEHEVLIQGTTLLAAAIDTTKTENYVLLLMLALHPDIQNKLYREITNILGADVTQVPSYDDIMKLDYLDKVLKECLRILPAAPFIMKKAFEDMKVTADDGEYTIPAGTMMPILIYSIHNNPDYYENPKLFDPDRWLPERVSQRHPNCFLPFSTGPRNCMGVKYAMLQMKIFAITMVRTFEILPSELCATMDDIKFHMHGTLKFENNCQIKLNQRDVKPKRNNDLSSLNPRSRLSMSLQ